jgi:fibronectin type 3 domain-containing protein
MPFTLTFVPRASGTAVAALSFASNAANSAAENLTGTGVAPPQHSVGLSWDPATAVVGYYVYRGSQSGGPYSKIDPVLDASTNFLDSSVQGGQNYYYVTTSVDSTGAQSSYSNEIQAVIPTP